MHPRATRPGVVLLPKSLVPVALAAAASAGFLLAFFFVLPFYTTNDPARTAGRGASASWLWPAHSRHPPSLSTPLPPIATTADADTDDALHLLPPSAPFPVPSSTPAADARPMAEVSTAQRVTDNGDEDRSCTIIINVYRGNPEALRIQLNQSLHQADNVSVTHVWVTSFASPNSGQYRAVVDAIRANNSANPSSVDFIESGFNFKFHGRFLLGLMAPTRYILMLDDDASISTTTVRNCINNINTPGRRGVYGGFGHLRASPERGTKYVFWPEESVDWKLHPDYYELDYLSRYWCFETA
ncbi:hypothetical protein HK405_006941 [Cladochytrium tenue]|nr:hypothetical protein HK405_006941 [Cladochytrium tenue]